MLKAALFSLFVILPLLAQVADHPVQAGPMATLPDHKIAPNDLIFVSVFDEPELSKSVRVGSDGTIILPELQSGVKVEGMLPREVEAEIARELIDQQLLVHPNVSVAILDYAARYVSVMGSMKNPGQFSITTPISLLDALAKAGWTTPDAGSDILLTKSNNEIPRRINIFQLQAGADPTLNVMLSGGETINVPEAPKVWVTGNVTHPQAVPIRNPNDATVLKVVASVEGLTQYYNKTAYIYRPDATGVRHEIPIPLKDMMHRKSPDVQLKADDILLIPDDNGTKRRAILTELASLGGVTTSTLIYAGMR